MTMRKVPYTSAWMPYPVSFKAAAATLNDGSMFLSEPDGRSKVAYTFACPVSGELEQFEFWMEKGPSDAATTIKISFQDLDTNGNPDGTPDEYRIIELGDISSAWVTPGIMSSDGTDNGALRTVTRGQKLACVIEFDAETAGDYIEFGVIPLYEDSVRRMPAGAQFYNGSWNIEVNGVAVGIPKYPGPLYYSMPECMPIAGITQTTINTGTTPDEVGIEFSIHADLMVGGASFCLSGAVNNAGWDCVLYDPSGAAIETVAMKLYTALFPASGYTYWTAKFSIDRRITANEIWRVTIKPSSASSIKLLEVTFNDTNIIDDLYWNGSVTQEDAVTDNVAHFLRCGRTDDGVWVTSDVIPLISLHVTGIEQRTGGATNDWTGDA